MGLSPGGFGPTEGLSGAIFVGPGIVDIAFVPDALPASHRNGECFQRANPPAVLLEIACPEGGEGEPTK